MNDDVAIKVEDVSKSFKLPHQRIGSIKHLVTNPLHAKRSYEVQHALKNINLEIKKGEFFGIVGRNGSGKSTLLKILAGIYQPTKGKVQVHGKLVPFIELGVGFNPELTGRENVYLNGALLGFSEKEVAGMYDDIVEFAELGKFMDQKLKNYSSGMHVRLAFSMATRSQADILLIDEVLAVGDADFQRKCFAYFDTLKRKKKTVIFVSHDMDAILEYCDKVSLIENSKITGIGLAKDVTKKYRDLFLDVGSSKEKGPSIEENGGGQGAQRLPQGTGGATLGTPVIRVGKDKISIRYKVEVINTDEVVCGIRIKPAKGVGIAGTSSKILNKKLANLHTSERISINWETENL